MRVLDIRKLSVQYHTEQGECRALEELDLHVEEGEITGLVGESGSGKSTAMLAVMGTVEGEMRPCSRKGSRCVESRSFRA